jgi:DNA-binding IclR family transcriptional regulator
MSNTLQSADRALRILLAFEREDQQQTLADIAELCGVHKSTASRLAGTLRHHGFLERAPGSDAYRLGPETARIGMLAVGGRDLITVARRPMIDLAAATGETVTLAVLHGLELTTVAQIDSRYIVGPTNWIGRRTPLHATSDGKVFLAFGEAKLPPGPLLPLTDCTHTRRSDLQRELDLVRRRGWAQAVGEFEYGLHGAAAAVVDGAGRCRAALCVSGPAYRISADDLPRLGEACRKKAAEIGPLLVSGTDPATPAKPAPARRRRAAVGGGRTTRA